MHHKPYTGIVKEIVKVQDPDYPAQRRTKLKELYCVRIGGQSFVCKNSRQSALSELKYHLASRC